MKIDGGCHCGRITYEAEVDPDKVGLCHCTDCQTLSGSAYRIGALAEPGTFKLLSGEPKLYEKIAESGNRRVQAFCPDCGTHLYSAAPETEPGVFRIRTATARQRAELPPKSQVWCRSAQSWVNTLESVPARQMQSG